MFEVLLAELDSSTTFEVLVAFERTLSRIFIKKDTAWCEVQLFQVVIV